MRSGITANLRRTERGIRCGCDFYVDLPHMRTHNITDVVKGDGYFIRYENQTVSRLFSSLILETLWHGVDNQFFYS